MKKIAVLCGIILLILPVSSVATSGQNVIFSKTESAAPGEIIAVSCSEPYPTLGQPVYLLITMQGKAGQRLNETISVTDEFSGFVMTNGEMKWISGNLTENQKDSHHRNITKVHQQNPLVPVGGWKSYIACVCRRIP